MSHCLLSENYYFFYLNITKPSGTDWFYGYCGFTTISNWAIWYSVAKTITG